MTAPGSGPGRVEPEPDEDAAARDPEVREAFQRLEAAVDAGEAAADEALEVTRELRARLEEALKGRRLTEGSLLLARKRRLRERLGELDGAIAEGAGDEARKLLAELGTFYPAILEEARQLPEVEARPSRSRAPPLVRNVTTVARKETIVALQSVQGLVLMGLFLATFGLGLGSVLDGATLGVEGSVELVWTYAHAIDFLSAPLAGILLGHALVNEERASDTIHFLASKPVSRTGIVLGKWVGMATALAAIVGLSALIVGGVAWSVTRTLGDLGVVLGYVAATYLLALVFGSVALALSTVLDRAVASLAASFGGYVVLGPVWQNAFLIRSLGDLGASPPVGRLLVYLASPWTAWWNWTDELLGPRSDILGLHVGAPWHAALVEAVERGELAGLPFYAKHGWYVFVMMAWCALAVGAAVAVMRRRDLA